jgi:aryl-alcohol dehydrogenase-like predicted oxidoreductase
LGVREKVVIGTKGGHPAIEPGYSRPDAYLAPEVIAQDVDESLERLGFASVDLYYLHRDDTRVPVGEIVDTLHQEVDQGRIRHLGASNWSVERLEAANAYAQGKGRQGFIASQVQWSLATPTWKIGPDPTTRYVTEDDVRWHTRTRLPIVAYSATASGYFSDTPRNPGLYNDSANPGRAERARTFAAQRKATPTQIALAYLACQSVPTIPLFSTANLAHLAEALDSIALTLSPEELTWLREG